MKKYLKDFPGFRSDVIWKKIIACLFYFAFIGAILSGGLEESLIFGGIILLDVSIIDLVKNKKSNFSLKTPVLLLLAGIILLSSGGQVASKNAIASIESEELKLVSEENEELKTEIKTLKEDKEKLESANLELEEENEKFLAEEKEREEELAKIEAEKEAEELAKEEARLAEEKKKEEEAEKQRQVKEQREQEEKETAAAKAQQSAKSNNSSNNSSNQGVSKPAPAPSAAENTEQVLVTPTGSKYHKRKCGNGNYSSSTLSNAKSRGLTPCKKCF